MSIEIEAKLKVDSLPKITNCLKKLNARFVEKQIHTDFYFDDENNRLKKTDCCLRLRVLKVGKIKTIFLTYKGAKQKDNFKKRTELELQINDLVSVKKILRLLGFRQKIVVEKKRSLWRLGSCTVSLDYIKKLGSFVEIEGPNDSVITEAQKKIGLAHLKHIPKSYACLIEGKKTKL